MSNKKLGNDFENRFINILSEEGFWCHLFAQNQAGQPADVIAVKNGRAYLIDCKVCSNDTFPFSRIEENQTLAMKHWTDCGNGNGFFALEMSNGEIFMLKYWTFHSRSDTEKSLSLPQIETLGTPLKRWMVRHE